MDADTVEIINIRFLVAIFHWKKKSSYWCKITSNDKTLDNSVSITNYILITAAFYPMSTVGQSGRG
jgi:hypothetical protein